MTLTAPATDISATEPSTTPLSTTEPSAPQTSAAEPLAATRIAATAASEPSAGTGLATQAAATGLAVLAASAWPESADDTAAPAPAGFIVSSFSPVAAEAARRCMERRPQNPDAREAPVTAVVVVSALGDVGGAVHVAGLVDEGERIGPLLFFQCVPNAVAGHVAARWGLTGPVVCVAQLEAGLETAALLIEDGDADQALLIHVEQAYTAGTHDRAHAVLLGAAAPLHSEGTVT